MASTIPELTKRLDDAFLTTWMEVSADAFDNVLESTPLWLALKMYNCLKTQVGGTEITRTVKYDKKSMKRFKSGSVLTQSTKNTETMARWDWRYFYIDINRSLVDDQINSGPNMIKSYLQKRITEARDALVQDLETSLFQWGDYYAAPKQFNGLYDIVAPQSAKTTGGDGSNSDTRTSGTSNGNINRSNTWWRHQEKAGTTPIQLNIEADMSTFWNDISQNLEPANFLVCSQDAYEYYQQEVSDKLQIVRSAYNKKAADLGFETCTYKGRPMMWSSNMPTISDDTLSEVIPLNLDYVEFVYDPNYWFQMTNWKETSNQFERVAYIVGATSGLITAQPRRHGYLYYTG